MTAIIDSDSPSFSEIRDTIGKCTDTSALRDLLEDMKARSADQFIDWQLGRSVEDFLRYNRNMGVLIYAATKRGRKIAEESIMRRLYYATEATHVVLEMMDAVHLTCFPLPPKRVPSGGVGLKRGDSQGQPPKCLPTDGRWKYYDNEVGVMQLELFSRVLGGQGERSLSGVPSYLVRDTSDLIETVNPDDPCGFSRQPKWQAWLGGARLENYLNELMYAPELLKDTPPYAGDAYFFPVDIDESFEQTGSDRTPGLYKLCKWQPIGPFTAPTPALARMELGYIKLMEKVRYARELIVEKLIVRSTSGIMGANGG